MYKYRKIIGLLGSILLLIGIGYYTITDYMPIWDLILVLFGSVLTVFYLTTDFSDIIGFARSRQAKYGTNTVISVIVFAILLSLIYFISVKNDFQLDFTKEKLFSISQQTKDILNSLKDDLNVYVFIEKNSEAKQEFEDLLDSYKLISDKFKYEFIDIDARPDIAEKYNVNEYFNSVVEYQGRSITVKNYKISPMSGNMELIIHEDSYTNAMDRLLSQNNSVLYFIKGHGERNIDDEKDREGVLLLKNELEKNNFQTKTIKLFEEEDLDTDNTILLILNPKQKFFVSEKEILKEYLLSGGRLLITLDSGEMNPLDSFMRRYCDTEFADDMIIDKMARTATSSLVTPIISDFTEHPIVKKLQGVIILPTARSLQRVDSQNLGDTLYSVTQLFFTGRQSWGEVDYNAESAEYNDGLDNEGPLSSGIAFELEVGKNKVSRIAAFGDGDFINNQYFNFNPPNVQLFVNSVKWLAGQEDKISIPPKEPETETIIVHSSQGKILFWSLIFLFPSLILIFGVFIWNRRMNLK